MAIYEDYTDRDSLCGIQITGQANIVEEMAEYRRVIKIKGMDMHFVKSLPLDLHLIRVDIEKVEFLNSDFKKQGYSIRQVLEF
jgi:hypothetical protein